MNKKDVKIYACIAVIFVVIALSGLFVVKRDASASSPSQTIPKLYLYWQEESDTCFGVASIPNVDYQALILNCTDKIRTVAHRL
jgi:hypothetical protein